MLERDLKEKVIKDLERRGFKKDKYGLYSCDIYADYWDEFDDTTIMKIVRSKNPKEAFYDQFSDYDFFEYDYLYSDIRSKFTNYKNEDKIMDWLRENVYFNLPYSHYENQEILVNIIANTGDEDFDYTCNNFLNYYADDVEDLEIMEESSILWLLKEQGYGRKDLISVIKGEHDENNKFLQSVFNELINSCSHMNALVFSVKMTLWQYINYIENPQDIILDKGTSCGLIDFWSGSGSLLGIEIDKRLTIPKQMVNMSIDGGHGYSIIKIYGMMSDYWTRTFIAA